MVLAPADLSLSAARERKHIANALNKVENLLLGLGGRLPLFVGG